LTGQEITRTGIGSLVIHHAAVEPDGGVTDRTSKLDDLFHGD
jgi:hypothetical protein